MASITNPSNSNEEFTAQVRSNGSDSIRIRGNLKTGGSSSDSTGKRYIYLELKGDNGDELSEWIESDQTSGDTFYFPGPDATDYEYIYGLSPGTTYAWTATIAWGTNSSSLSAWAVLTGEVTTEAATELWSWETSNGTATDKETQCAYSILNGDISVDEGLSHKVWNDFVDKVMTVRANFGDGTWDTVNGTYLSYAACKVEAGDRLSADLYNSVKVQIGSISATDIPDVKPGDRLTGYHIVHIAEVLNDIIASQ